MQNFRQWIMRLCAVLLAAAFLFGAAESLYRAGWACRRAWSLRGDKGGYFALYIVGESTATGEPYNPGISLAALVQSMFGGRVGGRPIRVFSLAMGGESVYPQAVALEQALRCRNSEDPGAVIIYSGHNDATSVSGIPVFERFRENVLSRSMLLSDLGFYAERRFPRLRVRTQDTYEHYLRRIVEVSLNNGLTPILSTVVSNISDVDPGLRLEPGPDRAEMEKILAKGLALEAGRRKEAIDYYSTQSEAHLQLRPYLEYRTGKCNQALGRYAEAQQNFREVVDSAVSDNFKRATSRQNDFIRVLAKQYAVPLADAEKIFGEHSPHGLLGDSLFSDGHHPNMAGYLLLAGAYAHELSEASGDQLRRSYTGPIEVFRAFSFGKEQQAEALVRSGRWFFSSAAGHAYPGPRLRQALARFQSAIALDPHAFHAWLGLGLAEAALNGGLLTDEGNLAWLAEHGLASYWEYDVTPGQLQEILKKISACGVAEATVDRIAAEAGRALAAQEPTGVEAAQARTVPPAGDKVRSKTASDLAVEKMRAGDHAAAEKLLREALAADGGNIEALMSLCGVLAGENKKEEALKNCRAAYSAVYADRSNQPQELKILASEAEYESYKLLTRLGRKREAIETLRACIKRAPPSWPGLPGAEAELK